jgi:hypothetical protein
MGSRVIADRLARVARGEARQRQGHLALVVVGLLLVTGLPSAFAYVSSPADRQFMGIVLNVPDTAQYLAWARESAGSFLIENTLTPERGRAVFLNLFWFGAGRLTTWLDLSLPAAFQVMRVVAGAISLLTLYWFVGLMTTSLVERWTSFLVIVLGGGLGWLLVVAKQFTGALAHPLLLYVVEPNTFLTLMAFPHQAMATGLMVLVLGLAARAFERDSLGLSLGAGLIALFLGLQHGYDLLHIYAFVGVSALVLAARAGHVRPVVLGLAVCLPSFPAALYLAAITRLDPIWSGVLAQYGNAGVFTPPPFLLVITLGLPLILLIVCRPPATERGPIEARELVLRVWLIVGLVLLYVPAGFQIKMLAGWQVPVAILAVRTWLHQVGPAAVRARGGRARSLGPILAVLAVALVLPLNLYLFAWRFVDLARHDAPYYLLRDDVAALRWIEANAAPSDVTLSSLTIGQYLPSVTGRRAFLAHWAQTLDFYGRRQAVAEFFDAGRTDRDRRHLLQQQGVRYVFHGPEERALGSYQPKDAPFLRRVFAAGETAIYQVVEGE